MHPNLLEKTNELAKEFKYEYHYEPNDLINIFSLKIQTQLHVPDREQYIESLYISICVSYPGLKPQIDADKDENMHCFLLYYDNDGVHQIEHPNIDRKGIYDFKDEVTAIDEINKIYIEMSGGILRPVTEYYDVLAGLTFKEFNDYINGFDEIKKRRV